MRLLVTTGVTENGQPESLSTDRVNERLLADDDGHSESGADRSGKLPIVRDSVVSVGLSRAQVTLFFLAATALFSAITAFFLATTALFSVFTRAGTAGQSDPEQIHAGSPKERSTIRTVAGMLHG
jgi:hypothetical protein